MEGRGWGTPDMCTQTEGLRENGLFFFICLVVGLLIEVFFMDASTMQFGIEVFFIDGGIRDGSFIKVPAYERCNMMQLDR